MSTVGQTLGFPVHAVIFLHTGKYVEQLCDVQNGGALGNLTPNSK